MTAGAAVVMAAFAVAISLPAGATAAPSLTLPVSVSGLKSGEVESVLASTPLEDLSAAQLAKPISELSGLGILSKNSSLQQALTETIKELAAKGGTLGQLDDSSDIVSELSAQLGKILPEPLLSLLLQGNNLSTLLTSGLGSLSPSQLVESLLTSATGPEREQLIEQILAAAAPELQSLLGSTLAGEPFETSNVNELASKVGMTTEGFDNDLESTTEQIRPTAMAVTAPLTDGKVLAALEGIDGLHLGLLEAGPEGTSGGTGGSGGSSGGLAGGVGGSGGSGASGAGGSGSGTPGTTVVVNNSTMPGAATPGATVSTASAKVKIVSHKVKGQTVTLVVQVPAAGTLMVSGGGVRLLRRQAAKAERVTLHLALSKAGAASLRKHRHGLRIKLDASFVPVSGASSSVATTVKVG
ncbi:MAG TPA: hypothetical protein VK680_03120 [Solirubrobacteraceae bacterium]|nr:hypothetical protein [Solirubrobacteraceae bacterium]